MSTNPTHPTTPPAELSAAVKANRCECHPETCCCADYNLHVGGEFMASGTRARMDKLAELINTRTGAARELPAASLGEVVYATATDLTSEDGKHVLYTITDEPFPNSDPWKLYDTPTPSTAGSGDALPAGWFTFVHDCAQTRGSMVYGNVLAKRAQYLLDAIAMDDPPPMLDESLTAKAEGDGGEGRT